MTPSESEIMAYLRGPYVKDMLRRGYRVQARARQLLGGAPGHPRRIDTGDLRSSVQVQLVKTGDVIAVRVGSNRKKARWVHDGTGIYGPWRRRIYPRRASVLVFTGRAGGKVFARSTKGMSANPFLRDALPAAKG